MDYTVRNFRWDDLAGLVVLINLASRADHDDFTATEDMLRHDFESPGVDIESSGFMAVAPDGSFVGGGFVRRNAETGNGRRNLVVHPAFRQSDIGAALIRRTNDYLLRSATPGDSPLYMQHYALASQTYLRNILEAEGHSPARYFYMMRIDLKGPSEPPVFSDGIVLRPFDRKRDGRALYEAHNDAFREHWGFAPQPFEQWEHNFYNEDRYDFGLWLIALDGDEIAGFSMNRIWGPEQPQRGWIDILGVRHRWRKKGLGAALLRESFARFRARSLTEAGLSVDTANPTGAVNLYKRVGMDINQEIIAYRQVLRGRAEE